MIIYAGLSGDMRSEAAEKSAGLLPGGRISAPAVAAGMPMC
ncbi:MAG TPA: hypothetical protein PK778_03910 [Bacillota bacterium]|nr:hypothetical protein [Bacillota bacterium]